MTRKKVKLSWIVNESARKQSLKKRKAGLLKKVKELSILCGVDTFIIIYGPGESEPTVWPGKEQVKELIQKFQSLPEFERKKKMMTQEDYLKERIAKSEEELTKIHLKNLEVELGDLMSQIAQGKPLDELHLSEMEALNWMLEEKLKLVDKRLFEHFYQMDQDPDQPPPPPLQGGHVVEEVVGIGGGGGGRVRTIAGDLRLDEWFNEMMRKSENTAGGSSVRNTYEPSQNAYDGGSYVASELGLPQGGFMGYDGSSDMGLSHVNLGVNCGASDIRANTQVNYIGHGGGSELGLTRLSFEGQNVASNIANVGGQRVDDGLGLSHINFDGNIISARHIGISSQANFVGLIGTNELALSNINLGSNIGASNLVPNQYNFGGQIGGGDYGLNQVHFETQLGGSDLALNQANFESQINGNEFGFSHGNFGGGASDLGLSQANFGGSSDIIDMANKPHDNFGVNNGENDVGLGLPPESLVAGGGGSGGSDTGSCDTAAPAFGFSGGNVDESDFETYGVNKTWPNNLSP